MEEIKEYLPVIIPLLVLQLALAAVAVVHAVRHPNYKFGSKPVWITVIVLLNIIGPVLYFTLGRGEDTGEYNE